MIHQAKSNPQLLDDQIFSERIALLYGPAARCKPKVMIWRSWGLALLYPALERNVCVPGHHGYPRASDLILG